MAVPVCQKESGACMISSCFGGDGKKLLFVKTKLGSDGVGGAEP